MKSKENLVFLGMMGSGKSSIGSLVAKKLKLNFVDIDKEIEKNLNITIKKIFEVKGENYFRKIEKQLTIIELKKNNSVISLGGGAFLNSSIRQYSKTHSISFWLDVPIEILIKRLKKLSPILKKFQII